MVDDFAALGISFFLFPQHRQPNRVKSKVFKRRGINAADCRLHRVQGSIDAQKLRMAIRIGDGRPLIPGSSLKGGIRTLLLAAWAGEGAPHSGKRFAPVREALSRLSGVKPSQRLEEALFHFSNGKLRANDPRTDVLKTLSVSDAVFAPSTLRVVSSIAVGTTRATLTAAEALDRGSSALLTLKLGDGFLAGRLPFTNAVPNLGTLASWSHQHARHLISGDLNFFKKLNEPVIVERLEELLEDVNKADADAIIIRVGWGTGWRTMTGDILTPEERDQVMRRVGKTRKVIINTHSSHGQPCDVFGWIRIDPIGGAAAAALAALTKPPGQQQRESVPPAQPNQESGQPLIPKRDSFDSSVMNLKGRDWGKVHALYEQAMRHPESDERERRLKLLANKLEEVFGRDKKRLQEITRFEGLARYLKRK